MTDNTKRISPTYVLPPNEFLLAGVAYIFLAEGSLGGVSYEIVSKANSDGCTGTLSAPQKFVDLIVAQDRVVLCIAPGQAIEIDLEGPSALEGIATFTCRNPLLGAGGTRAAAEHHH